MSDTTETDSSIPEGTHTPNQSSPLPGCLILSTIVLVFGGLIVLYTIVGSYQNRKFDELTVPDSIELTVLSPDEAEVRATREKFEAIGDAIEAGRAERFLIEARDLNVLIATEEDLADFRRQTWIERISNMGIVARMVQPMRSGVFRKGTRYLEATFVLRPELRARTVAFEVMNIRSEMGEIPEGFIQNYRALDFFKLDPEWELIRKYLPGVAAVYVEGDQIVIETKVALEEEAPAE